MENWFSPELIALIRGLEKPGAYVGLLLCLAAFPIAWGALRVLRGPASRPGSIVFGSRIVDGVLFPALWLGLVWLARTLCLRAHLPLAVFRLAVPMLVSLLMIRLTVRVMQVAFPKSGVARVIEKTVSWLAWLGVVLWITGVLPSFLDALDEVTWKMGGSKVSLASILEGGLGAAIALLLALWISSGIEAALLKGALGQQLSWRKAAANVVRTVLVFVGLLMALSAAGIDLTALSVLGGAIGVGLGFGLQKLAANYVSGFVILLERSIRIGDNVKVDSFEGRITDIKTRYTLIRAGNGREAIVPNESLITSRVENLTHQDLKFNITTTIVVPYGSDVGRVQEILCSAARAQPRVMTDPVPVAYLVNFAPDGLEFSLNVWVKDPDKGQVNLSPAAGYQFFGHVAVDGRTEQMTVTLKDAADTDLLRAVAARAPAAIALPNGHVAFGAALALFERADTPDDALHAVLDDPASPTQLRKEAARQTVHPVIRQRLAQDPDESVRRNATKPRST